MTNPLFKALESAAAGTSNATDEVLSALPFDVDGLVPVIAQQRGSGEVLMLAWMNRAALDETLRTGQMCYYSRSRARLWRKGEVSGNTQRLIELRLDCDGDALLATVDQTGPACHTGRRACFYLRVQGDQVSVTSAPERSPEEMYAPRR
jgi:phosphoribosyl-AMP cyclohydrolase